MWELMKVLHLYYPIYFHMGYGIYHFTSTGVDIMEVFNCSEETL